MNDRPLAAATTISLRQIFGQFLFVGAISFGGGIVAYLRELLVTRRQWVSSDEFMVLLSISQTMPGLNAVNLSILMGDRLRGGRGALVAALGILLPGALVVLGIGTLYGIHGDHPVADRLLAGVMAAAIALLATVTWKLGRRAFSGTKSLALVVLTFVCMSVLKWPLYLVLATVLPLALFLYRPSARNAE